MAQYKTGTVTVTNGSNVVTGSGTSWLGNVEAGDWFKIDDRAPIYQIASVVSNTQLTLTINYAQASGSGLSYCIVTDFTPNLNLPLIFKGDIDWPDIYNRCMTNLDSSTTILNKNFIYNGCARVFQRPSAFTLALNQWGFGADRWAGMATGTTVTAGTLTQATSAPVGRTGFAFHFSGVTITGTGVIWLRYRMESRDAKNFKNQIASFSCKIFHDVGSAINYTVFVRRANAEDNFANVTEIANSGTISRASGTALDLKFENISMGDCSTGVEIAIRVDCGAITNRNFYFTELQFELGPVATPFERRPFEQELALCQRYYERHGGVANGYPRIYLNATGSLYVGTCMTFNTTKRVTPTLVKNGTWYVVNCGQPVAETPTINGYFLITLASASGAVITNPDSSDDWISADAEL